MITAKKVAANRQNARKSTGPKTTKGKERASRNAMRHGLETVSRHNSSVSAQIEHIAQSICGDTANPAQYEQALIIAESEVVLLHVRVAAIERAEKNAPSSNALIPGLRIFSGRIFSAKMSASVGDGKQPDQAGKDHRQSAVQGDGDDVMSTSRNPTLITAGSELDALRRALPDLMSLDRYARRASSRRRRAIRNFIANSIAQSSPGRSTVRLDLTMGSRTSVT